MRFVVEIIVVPEDEEFGTLEERMGRDSVFAALKSEVFNLDDLEAEGVPINVTLFRETGENPVLHYEDMPWP